MIGENGFLWLSLVSAVTFVTSLVALPWLATLIPADYFLHEKREPSRWNRIPPALRLLLILLKNVLGMVLLAGGFIMLFVPGQGLLTIAMGMLLLDYPGKYQLERWLVSHKPVLKGLNWLRAKRGAAPLEVDP